MAKTASRCILVVLASTYLTLLLLSSHVALIYAPQTHASAWKILKTFMLQQNWSMFANPKIGLAITSVTAIDKSGYTSQVNFIPEQPFDILGVNSQYWRLIGRVNAGVNASIRTDFARYLFKTKDGQSWDRLQFNLIHWSLNDRPYEEFAKSGVLRVRNLETILLPPYFRESLVRE